MKSTEATQRIHATMLNVSNGRPFQISGRAKKITSASRMARMLPGVIRKQKRQADSGISALVRRNKVSQKINLIHGTDDKGRLWYASTLKCIDIEMRRLFFSHALFSGYPLPRKSDLAKF